jgi:2-oxoglutarate ferredoxin oxidoreductase subunit delta
MILVEDVRCKSCRLCVEYCPKKCLEISNKINSKGYKIVAVKEQDKCSGCGICYLMCPDVAITVVK